MRNSAPASAKELMLLAVNLGPENSKGLSPMDRKIWSAIRDCSVTTLVIPTGSSTVRGRDDYWERSGPNYTSIYNLLISITRGQHSITRIILDDKIIPFREKQELDSAGGELPVSFAARKVLSTPECKKSKTRDSDTSLVLKTHHERFSIQEANANSRTSIPARSRPEGNLSHFRHFDLKGYKFTSREKFLDNIEAFCTQQYTFMSFVTGPSKTVLNFHVSASKDQSESIASWAGEISRAQLTALEPEIRGIAAEVTFSHKKKGYEDVLEARVGEEPYCPYIIH